MGWVVNATPWPLYPWERPGAHCIGGWWATGLIWMGAENLAPTGIRSPDRPARSESLYRLRNPGSHLSAISRHNQNMTATISPKNGQKNTFQKHIFKISG